MIGRCALLLGAERVEPAARDAVALPRQHDDQLLDLRGEEAIADPGERQRGVVGVLERLRAGDERGAELGVDDRAEEDDDRDARWLRDELVDVALQRRAIGDVALAAGPRLGADSATRRRFESSASPI